MLTSFLKSLVLLWHNVHQHGTAPLSIFPQIVTLWLWCCNPCRPYHDKYSSLQEGLQSLRDTVDCWCNLLYPDLTMCSSYVQLL